MGGSFVYSCVNLHEGDNSKYKSDDEKSQGGSQETQNWRKATEIWVPDISALAFCAEVCINQTTRASSFTKQITFVIHPVVGNTQCGSPIRFKSLNWFNIATNCTRSISTSFKSLITLVAVPGHIIESFITGTDRGGQECKSSDDGKKRSSHEFIFNFNFIHNDQNVLLLYAHI